MVTDPVTTRLGPRDRSRDKRRATVRAFTFKPRKLKKAKPEDVKQITKKVTDAAFAKEVARSMGFELTEEQVKIVRTKVEIRVKRHNTTEINKAKRAFINAIAQIRSQCVCRSGEIRAKVRSEHHAGTWNGIVGPGGRTVGGSTITEITFLYCEDCGQTYYNSQVEKLSQRYASGEFEPKLLIATQYDRRRFGDFRGFIEETITL